MLLYHGSRVIVPQPEYGKGVPFNDYGSGFYCTEHLELAKEWACQDLSGGYVNRYELDTNGFAVLELNHYSILHWLALLVHNRRFRTTSALMAEGKEWLEAEYLLDLEPYDLIVGYRADDSYFRFARAFLQNGLSIEALEQAMHLGELGEQIVLKSQKSFDRITFQSAESVDGAVYYQRRLERDALARAQYDTIQKDIGTGGTYLLDLLRREEERE